MGPMQAINAQRAMEHAKALVFDLDDTLIIDKPAYAEAFRAIGHFASERFGLPADGFVETLQRNVDAIFSRSPWHSYCHSVGISATEALWCNFECSENREVDMRAWGKAYQAEVWSATLAEWSVADPIVAADMAQRFIAYRRACQRNDDDATRVLEALSSRLHLALLTNGARSLQRQKIGDSGLGKYFNTIVVSSEIGTGKPDPRIFAIALNGLGVATHEAVMIGDNPMRDVEGALNAGMHAIWIDRSGRLPDIPCGSRAITRLTDLLTIFPG